MTTVLRRHRDTRENIAGGPMETETEGLKAKNQQGLSENHKSLGRKILPHRYLGEHGPADTLISDLASSKYETILAF